MNLESYGKFTNAFIALNDNMEEWPVKFIVAVYCKRTFLGHRLLGNIIPALAPKCYWIMRRGTEYGDRWIPCIERELAFVGYVSSEQSKEEQVAEILELFKKNNSDYEVLGHVVVETSDTNIEYIPAA
jgi:hypothetical protein